MINTAERTYAVAQRIGLTDAVLENTGGGTMCLVYDPDDRSEYIAVVGGDRFDVCTYTREGWYDGDQPMKIDDAESAAEAIRIMTEGPVPEGSIQRRGTKVYYVNHKGEVDRTRLGRVVSDGMVRDANGVFNPNFVDVRWQDGEREQITIHEVVHARGV